ncbi:TLC domain-containing protein [Pelagophyceae sp. CCMP2097]|nr:TLC domain-containing protein [Pelagophyceae sp. CCMP2097]
MTQAEYVPFFYAFFCAVALEGSVLLLSAVLSPRFFPEAFRSFENDPKRFGFGHLWHTTVAGVGASIFGPACAFPALLDLARNATASGALVAAPPAKLWVGLGFSMAHFFLDAAVMLAWRKPFLAAMRKPLYFQMLAHHGLSLLLWPYALASHRVVGFIAYFMCTECSALFLNARWLIVQCSPDGAPRPKVVDALFFASFVLTRIVPVPVACYVVWMADTVSYVRDSTSLAVAVTLLTVPIPFALNAFWFNLVLKSARRATSDSASAKKA